MEAATATDHPAPSGLPGDKAARIVEAMRASVGARGFNASTFDQVARAAGVSRGLLHYYFGTKEQLLLYATQYLAVALADRAKARIAAAGPDAGPRAIIEAILAEALPDDEDSRVFNVIWTSYLALSLTDPALDMGPLARDSNVIIDVIAAQLRAAQNGGTMPPGLDADLEATSLVALSAGLGTSVLVGDRDAAQAWAVIRYQLDRLLPPGAGRR